MPLFFFFFPYYIPFLKYQCCKILSTPLTNISDFTGHFTSPSAALEAVFCHVCQRTCPSRKQIFPAAKCNICQKDRRSKTRPFCCNPSPGTWRRPNFGHQGRKYDFFTRGTFSLLLIPLWENNLQQKHRIGSLGLAARFRVYLSVLSVFCCQLQHSICLEIAF